MTPLKAECEFCGHWFTPLCLLEGHFDQCEEKKRIDDMNSRPAKAMAALKKSLDKNRKR